MKSRTPQGVLFLCFFPKGGEFKNMPMIYDLDNEYGGRIISDSDSAAPALQVNSNAAGQSALAITSTASAAPLLVRTVTINDSVGSRFQGAATAAVGLTVGRTQVGSTTIAPLRVQHPSTASAAVLGFGGGFISVTSILGIAATGAAIAFDYVLPVELNGVVRGIPLTSLISLPGPAVF